ncbi:MAG: histidine--tRNA ligase [Bacteroidota bacterium]
MATNVSIPKGTRDFNPIEMTRRNYIFDTIKSIFTKYGFQPIETPAMENLSTLLGKYGEEGDKLLFKVLNSGDFLSSANEDVLSSKNSNKLVSQISEKGLRYDLTVPFARFVVQHQNEISFPFKRFQIQPVWRADRPQKGRYREFYQCDVDVIGSNSLINELELIQIISEVFKNLNINTVIKLNNRKILSGLAEVIGAADKIIDITVAIDKLDKIGLDKVNEELLSKGISEEALAKLQPIIMLNGTNEEKISTLSNILSNSEIGMLGISELNQIFEYLKNTPVSAEIELDITLARGLNYYTGAIFEVKAADVAMGSICGGGRYDDLTGIFGLKNMSGVGVSFGADRIYDVLNELNLFPENASKTTEVLFANFGGKEELFALKLLEQIRLEGINAEIYPDSVAKLKKQLTYADFKRINWVVLIGENEIKEGLVTIKNLSSGNQEKIEIHHIINYIRK